MDPKIPPMAKIEGLDLVTEGVLTIGKTLELLHRFERDDFDESFFDELDAENGAAKLAKALIEECTDVNLFVGKALNQAHIDTNLSFELSLRMNVVDRLRDCLKRIGKNVTERYY